MTQSSMKVLTASEIDCVSGGDSWAGTAAGRAPHVSKSEAFNECVAAAGRAGNYDNGLTVLIGCLIKVL